MPFLSIDLLSFFHQIDENGFTIFVTGFIFILSTYHFLLYFQYRNRAYLYYSLYTFLVLVHSYYRADYFFIRDALKGITPFITFMNSSVKWGYSTIYILFAISFIDLYKYPFKWNKLIKNTIVVSIFFLLLLSLLSFVLNDKRIVAYPYKFVGVPLLLLLAIVTLILIVKTKPKYKYYLIVGYSIFTISAISTQVLSFLGYDYRIIFYFGIIVESILFALGLGAKQRSILIEKNTTQKKVIEKHNANLQLQEEIKLNLDREVALKSKEILSITNKRESDERHKMQLEFSQKTIDLRMKALQTQMNPHFLFNSLNSIKHFIIENEKENATFFLSKLSQLIRKILDNSQRKEITLEEELSIMQLYVDVENIRLKKEVVLNITVDDSIDLQNIKLPPMVLQPFIENAIWHGLALVKGKKNISINVKKKDNDLQISIEDNGIGRERAAQLKAAKLVEKKSLGIALTIERLKIFTEHLEKEITIHFEDLYKNQKPSGTIVYITIPDSNTR